MEGFDLAMFKAQQFERKTNKKAAVFVVNEKTASFTDLSNIDKVEGICCYFTTDGKEHEIEKTVEKTAEPVSEETTQTTTIKKRSRRKKS